MCALNHISGEPPCHTECAEFSAIACPFLTKPLVKRRDNNLPEGVTTNEGHIARNPGVTAVWVTKNSWPVENRTIDGHKSVLFRFGDPTLVLWFREGRKATVEEVKNSILSGVSILREEAQAQGQEAVRELAQAFAETLLLVDRTAA